MHMCLHIYVHTHTYDRIQMHTTHKNLKNLNTPSTDRKDRSLKGLMGRAQQALMYGMLMPQGRSQLKLLSPLRHLECPQHYQPKSPLGFWDFPEYFLSQPGWCHLSFYVVGFEWVVGTS